MVEVKALKGIPSYKVKQPSLSILPNLPFRAIIAGPSQAGKGNLMSTMLLDPEFYRGCFAKIYFFSPSSTVDPALIPLKAYCEEHLEQGEDDPCLYDTWDAEVVQKILDKQKKVITYQRKHKHPKEHSICIVVDDFADQPQVVRKGLLETLFIRMRHFQVSTIVSSQRYRLLAPSVRVNASALVVFKLRNKTDLDSIMEENSAQVEQKALRNMYYKATSDAYGFLYIKLASNDIDNMFYSSFKAKFVVRS